MSAPALRRRRRRRGLLLLGILVAHSALMVVLGAMLHKHAFFNQYVMPYVKGSWNWPAHRVKGALARPDVLRIDMNWESYQRLAYQRAQALEENVLQLDSEAFVPCTIHGDGRQVRARIRLKGDSLLHLEGTKWSFRVQVRGDAALFGMKQLSLHHPRARNWLFEWLAQRAMRREGVIGLRYEFVQVVLNGRDLGIYALEEHFEKRLVENNERREGPIIRFGEDLMWRELSEQAWRFPGAERGGAGDYLASEPDGFQTASMLDDPALRAQYLRGLQLLERFRRGEASTSETFDLQRLATYFALIDVLGAEHGARWHNIRFYYNPVTCLLEPIAFDMNAGQPIHALSGADTPGVGPDGRIRDGRGRFLEALFADTTFAAQYLTELERVSNPEYVDTLLAELNPDLDAALAILYKEYPYYEFSPEILYKNQAYIRTMLNPPKGVHAYLKGLDDGGLALKVGNIQSLPVAVLGVAFPDGRTVDAADAVVLSPRAYDAPVRFEDIHLPPLPFVPESAPADGLELVYRILGTSQFRRAPIGPDHLDLEIPDPTRAVPNAETFEFLEFDASARTIRIPPGQWSVARDLIIPPGYMVVAAPGAELDLVDSALVLSRSPLGFEGLEDAPIVVRSSDGTGRGLVVMQAAADSVLAHVQFRNLSCAERPGWAITGAVTFYESPVSLSDCLFAANTSEDGLNIIRSEFRMERCTFEDTAFDAFDADFCRGSVTDCVFRGCGNDALDVSGSVTDVVGLTAVDCGDKGISAGEASRVVASRVVVERTRLGLAAKDVAELIVRDVTLADCQYGLAAYQKKPEFGPGTLRVTGLRLEGSPPVHLVERGSTVAVDGRALPVTHDDVKPIVYPAEAGP